MKLCRTHFSYEVAEHGEMSFKRGDVFLVVDTLYGGVVGSWQASRIVRNSPQDAKKGIIPNLSRYGHGNVSLCSWNFCSLRVLIFYVFCVEMTSSVKLTRSLIRTVSCIKVLIVINATKNFN